MSQTEKISEWIYHNSKLLSIIALLGYALAASGLFFAEFKSDFRSAFKEDSALIKNFDQINDQYEQGETLALYLKFSNSGEISAQNINAIKYADDLVNTLPYVRYVRSLSSYQKPFSDEDSIVAKYLGDWAQEKGGLTGANQYIRQQPQLLGSLIATDYSGALVLAQLDLTEPLHQSTLTLMRAAESAAKQIEQANAGVKVHISGTVAADAALQSEFMDLLVYGTPAIIGCVSLVVAWLFASPYISMSGLATSGITLVTAAGIFGWMPIYFDQTAIMSVLLVMLLTVLDCIHISSTYRACLSHSLSKEAAIKESIRANLKPIFFTTITTGVGLITMLFSGSPPYVLFAQIALVGIFLGLVYSFIFMTSLTIWLPEPKMSKAPTKPFVDFARHLSFKKPKQVIAVFIIITLTALSAIPLNTIDEDPTNLLKAGNKFDIAIETIRTDLAVDNQLLIDLSTTDGTSITSPEIIASIERFETWLQSDPTVVHAYTVNDVTKEIKNTWDNLPNANQLPETKAAYEQLLLVYEMSLQAGQSASEFISQDHSRTLLTIVFEDHSNRQLLIKRQRIEQWWAQQGLNINTAISSRDLIFAQLAEDTVHNSILGGGIAAVLITLLMIFSFGSVKWGLFSLIPNALPFILLFGLWALLSGEISQATCMAFTMVIGVVVDDSIHFITKFREAKETLGIEDALNKTFDFVGSAITIGSIAFIVDGVLIYLSSDFIPIMTMGVFTLLTFALAWLCDLLLMPAILILYYRRKEAPLTHNSVSVDEPISIQVNKA